MSIHPEDNLFIPGANTVLELSAKGSASDVRSWVRARIGKEGGPLFINSIAEPGDVNTFINLRRGSVCIGTSQSRAKLNVDGGAIISGGLLIKGSLGVTGLKNLVQDHPVDATKEIAYCCLESGEPGTFVRGSGAVQEGEGVIRFPEHFRLTTDDAQLTAQLTPRGVFLQLYVTELSTERLVVREAEERDGEFDYLVQGVRRGFADFEPIRERSVYK